MFKSLWHSHGGHIRTVPPCGSMHLPNPELSLDDNTSSCKPCLHCRALGETLSAWGRMQPAFGNAPWAWDQRSWLCMGTCCKTPVAPPGIPARAAGLPDVQTVLQALGVHTGGHRRGWCNGMVSAQLKCLRGLEPERITWESNISSPLRTGDSGTLQGERPLPSQPSFLFPDSRCYAQPFLLQNDNNFH